MARCAKHSFEEAVAACSRCADGFCQPCLIYPRGPHKPAMCLDCAMVASGIRRGGRRVRVRG